MASILPSTHTAGDSASWIIDAPSGAEPSGGWSAQLVLIGASTRISINGSASGTSAFAFAVTASVSAAWAAGDYTARLIATRGQERVSAVAGALRVLPDPAAAGTLGSSMLSAAQRHLAALQEAYAAYVASGNFVAGEVRVGDRSRKYRTVPELLQAINAAKQEVEAETQAQALAAGQSARRRFVVRM